MKIDGSKPSSHRYPRKWVYAEGKPPEGQLITRELEITVLHPGGPSYNHFGNGEVSVGYYDERGIEKHCHEWGMVEVVEYGKESILFLKSLVRKLQSENEALRTRIGARS